MIPLCSSRPNLQAQGLSGKLDLFIQGLHAAHPLDFGMEFSLKIHPDGTYANWSDAARQWIRASLNEAPELIVLTLTTLSDDPRSSGVLNRSVEQHSWNSSMKSIRRAHGIGGPAS